MVLVLLAWHRVVGAEDQTELVPSASLAPRNLVTVMVLPAGRFVTAPLRPEALG